MMFLNSIFLEITVMSREDFLFNRLTQEFIALLIELIFNLSFM